MVDPAQRHYLLSTVAQSWIHLNGKPFSLADWPMNTAFYDGRYRRTLLMTSRQVAKSTTMANLMITESCTIPYFSTMYVSPTQEQTRRFSNTRVSKTMKYSPIINKTFLTSDLADRIFHKQYSNGSEMIFTYGTEDADRLRGPSTDRNLFDEVQDMLFDPIVVVGNETMANSEYQFETYAGTPKTMENTIQYLWEQSTQTEWVMQCTSCKKYNIVVSEKSIGKDGPVCVRCQKYLNPFMGFWVDTNPVNIGIGEDVDNKIKGFHYGQIIMPLNVPLAMASKGTEAEALARIRWKRILAKLETVRISTFRNEVIGVSDAIGVRLLAKHELEALCTNRVMYQQPNSDILKGISFCVAGVDWSGGGTAGVSRTVLWIWGWRQADQRLVCLFYKVFPNQNPVHIVEEIASICKLYSISMAVGDAGEGHMANTELRMRLGGHLVHQVQYGSFTKAMTWNSIDRYQIDRTIMIDNYFMLIKRGGVEFANKEDMKVAFTDILNEYEEVTTSGKKVWRHSQQRPDDCLHAGLFGWLAFKIVKNDLLFYQ